MTPAPLKLTFNFIASEDQNDNGPVRTLRITPQGPTATLFPPGFTHEAESILTLSLSQSLFFAATALHDYIKSVHPSKNIAETIDFIDEDNNTQTISTRFTFD